VDPGRWVWGHERGVSKGPGFFSALDIRKLLASGRQAEHVVFASEQNILSPNRMLIHQLEDKL
jgi:hypothetical protein